MAKYGFRWDEDTLTPALQAIDTEVERFIIATLGYHAPQAESYAKQNARWVDRTTNARNSLFATTDHGRNVYRIVVGHGVPYGIWLEVRFAGRYAIIEDTIRSEGKEVMKTIRQGLFPALGKGS